MVLKEQSGGFLLDGDEYSGGRLCRRRAGHAPPARGYRFLKRGKRSPLLDGHLPRFLVRFPLSVWSGGRQALQTRLPQDALPRIVIYTLSRDPSMETSVPRSCRKLR